MTSLFKAGLLVLAVSPYSKSVIAAELVMVESATCTWCDLWEEEVGVVYAQTPTGTRAPIRRLTREDLKKQSLNIMHPVTYTPTFILLRNRQEVGRITGYPGEGHFWALLDELLQQLPNAKGYKCTGNQGKLVKTGEALGKQSC